MDPVTIAAGLLALLKPVMEYIAAKVKSGEMSAAEQTKLQQDMDDIRSGAAFDKPHWKGRNQS